MITLTKLHEYKEYDGYYDGFYVQKVKTGKNIISSDEWQLLTLLIQDVQLVLKGLTSKEFALNLEKTLKDNFDNDETIKEFRRIALELMK